MCIQHFTGFCILRISLIISHVLSDDELPSRIVSIRPLSNSSRSASVLPRILDSHGSSQEVSKSSDRDVDVLANIQTFLHCKLKGMCETWQQKQIMTTTFCVSNYVFVILVGLRHSCSHGLRDRVRQEIFQFFDHGGAARCTISCDGPLAG
jgi:hypothetical protein